MTNALPTSPAVDGELLRVNLAPVLGLGRVSRPPAVRAAPSRPAPAALLQRVQLLRDLLHPAAVDQLVDVQRRPAVRALRPLLRDTGYYEIIILDQLEEIIIKFNKIPDPEDCDFRSKIRNSNSLLREPPPDAEVTAELGAVRAEVRVLQLLHADEAPEHVGQRLDRRVLGRPVCGGRGRSTGTPRHARKWH